MKRIVRSKSGREVYGPKWQNNETDISYTSAVEDDNGAFVPSPQVSGAAVLPPKTNTSEFEDDDGAVVPSAKVSDAEVLPPENKPTAVDDQIKISQGIDRRGTRVSDRHQSMYRAALEGDCVAVEMLLEEDPNLACDEISEEGDRALHIAASMEHQKLVQKLVERMGPSDLALYDGRGYTACCYVAILGSINMAELMIRKNRNLAILPDRENKTPLLKAALLGKAKMVSYFLKAVKNEDLSTDEWFDILLVSIRHKMYGVALRLSRRIEQLATMNNDEGTALHLLARQDFFITRWQRVKGMMRRDMRLLAKNLWAGMQRLGQANVSELLKNPNILHDAAVLGNVELISMVTYTYPDLIWQTNDHGHTIFHLAVKHRHETLFQLINEIGARKYLISISQDRDGNNILHLAAPLAPLDTRILEMPAYQFQKEMMWFENVKAIVPPFCLEMKNNEGYTPRELFSKMHKSLLDASRTWMRNTADSCLLISTLIFTVAFGSAFAVPGGYNQESGIPVLYRSNWFTCFVIFEAFTMFSSALCMINVWSIMVSSFEEYLFLKALPRRLGEALSWLSMSVGGAISAFMSAYFLIYVERKAVLITCAIISVYILLVHRILLINFFFYFALPRNLFRKRNKFTLLKRHALTATENKFRFWIF